MRKRGERCEICSEPATLHLADPATGVEALYCKDAECVRRRGGEYIKEGISLSIRQWRPNPDNILSERLQAPKESSDHDGFRVEMCELQLLGAEGACRYYLSMITGTDQFAAWSDHFRNDLKEFVVSQTCQQAAKVFELPAPEGSLSQFMRIAWERFEGIQRRPRKEERAVELLLNHPQWSDEQFVEHLQTTYKQLDRWADFRTLRWALRR